MANNYPQNKSVENGIESDFKEPFQGWRVISDTIVCLKRANIVENSIGLVVPEELTEAYRHETRFRNIPITRM